MSDLLWFVAHTKPRREKKLVEYCARQGLAATLPCFASAHKYRGKTVVFQKPLFPGYVFLQLDPAQKSSVRQNDHVANLLEVFDQETVTRQLAAQILRDEAVADAGGRWMWVRPSAADLGHLGDLAERGALTVPVARTFPLAQAADAFRLSQEGHAGGKIVIRVSDPE